MLRPMDHRCYPRWDERGFWAHNNVANPVEMALWWFEAQGEKPYDGGRFSSNAGRKSLARWCHHLNVPYVESFEIHGDLQDTWLKYYQKSLKNDRLSRQRNQSRQPEPCLTALRRFAKYCGRGSTEDDPLELANQATAYVKKCAEEGREVDFATAVMTVQEGKHK